MCSQKIERDSLKTGDTGSRESTSQERSDTDTADLLRVGSWRVSRLGGILTGRARRQDLLLAARSYKFEHCTRPTLGRASQTYHRRIIAKRAS